MDTKVIFLDCGQTLIDANPPVEVVFTEEAQRRGHDITLDDVRPHMAAVSAFYDMRYMKDGDFWSNHADTVEIWFDMYRLLCHLVGLTDDVEGISSAVFDRFMTPACWEVLPEVSETLSALVKARYRLAVVSNWDAGLETLLRGLGILPYFEAVFASAALGYRKPNPVLFEIACERMGVQPGECCHVGDNLEADGDGAHNAGIEPILFDEQGRFGSSEYRSIRRFSELTEIFIPHN